MADELWREEREFWLGGVAETARKIDPACVMVFANTGILDRSGVIAALQSVPRWQEITMTDRATVETDEVCLLAYRATLRRARADAFRALCTTTWIRRAGDWRIIQHQQTPL